MSDWLQYLVAEWGFEQNSRTPSPIWIPFIFVCLKFFFKHSLKFFKLHPQLEYQWYYWFGRTFFFCSKTHEINAELFFKSCSIIFQMLWVVSRQYFGKASSINCFLSINTNNYTISQGFSKFSLSKTSLLDILKIQIHLIPIPRNSDLKGPPIRSKKLFNKYPRSV